MMTPATQSALSSSPAVIVASSNASLREKLIRQFLGYRIAAMAAMGGADALGKLEASECNLLLLDHKLADLDTEELLQIVHDRFPGIDVLMLDEAGRVPLSRPAGEWRSESTHHVFETITRWNAPSTAPPGPPSAPEPQEQLPGMIGSSTSMMRVAHMVRRVAPHNTPVLITGATGTGKEVVAKAIHQLSPRAAKPFSVINCAAIPEALLESELFGYVRGAFTGAVQSHVGRIQSANGGTLFLDEIGELPPGMQAKLLRFLDQGEVQRLGSSDTCRVDVRVISATNADLAGMAQRNLFRQDLIYRLAVFPIDVPPLAERRSDITALALHFLQKFQDSGTAIPLSTDAARLLQEYSWPGNVRELQHVMERALIMADGGGILPEHLGLPEVDV
jgi:DNA-binding NtrC family response regulator